MIDPLFGPDSVLPYAHVAYEPALRDSRARRVFRAARPWMYAVTLFLCGVSIARSASLPVRALEVRIMAPVVVDAPTRSEMHLILRGDTLARMLTRKHVDSATATALAIEFVRYGEEVKVSPRLLVAIAYTESQFNSRARSPAGAVGLMQVVPSRASWSEYEPRCGRMSARTLHDPRVNICFGAHIFREFLTRHNGDTDHALAAYNNGSGELNGYPDRVYTSLALLRH